MFATTTLKIKTRGRGILDITASIRDTVAQYAIKNALCHLFCQHTSASLILCENYDGDVKVDIETFLSDLVQDGDSRFTHRLEGEDDMAAHIRTLLTQSELSIPVIDGELALGRWQGVCLYEHRYHAHERHVVVSLLS